MTNEQKQRLLEKYPTMKEVPRLWVCRCDMPTLHWKDKNGDLRCLYPNGDVSSLNILLSPYPITEFLGILDPTTMQLNPIPEAEYTPLTLADVEEGRVCECAPIGYVVGEYFTRDGFVYRCDGRYVSDDADLFIVGRTLPERITIVRETIEGEV